MFAGLLRRIRQRLGVDRSLARAATERVKAECADLGDAEIVEKAAEALSSGDRARAAALLTVAAERGDREGQYRLGDMLANGDVPTPAFPQGEASYRMQRAGVRWLSSAAQAGHAGAQARLGLIYLVNPDAVRRDEGRRLLETAAAAGDPLALQHVQASSKPRADGESWGADYPANLAGA